MMKIIDIPLVVISELNVREHWRKGHLRHKGQKFLVKNYLKNHNLPQMLPVIITMTRIGKKKLDSDNLQGAFKYVRDAIAEYFFPGLAAGRADENEEMTWKYDQEIGDPHCKFTFDWDINNHPWITRKEVGLCEDYGSGTNHSLHDILPKGQ